jgi:hypothetical protein
MTTADQKLAERVLKGIYRDYDWSGTRIHPLQQAFGERAVQAALCADFLEQKGIWVVVTTKGMEYHREHLTRKPRPRKLPRDLEYEEALIRARVAVELLERARPGSAPGEARTILRQIANQQSHLFDTLTCPDRYRAEYDELREKFLTLV